MPQSAENDEKPPIADALRHGAAESRHPHEIDEEMHPAGMHQHVGHEGGDRGEIAAGKLLRSAAIARRNEGKREQELQALLGRQQDLDELHPDHQPCQQDHHPRDIEHRFGGAHRRNLHRSPC